MNKKNIKDSMDFIDDDLIEEASYISTLKKKIWPKVVGIAACFVLVIVGVFGMPLLKSSSVEIVLAANYPEGYNFDEFDKWIKVNEQNPIDEESIDNINIFSYKTASKVLNNKGKNMLYSPLSLYYALALVTEGASGKTEEELLNLLHVSDKDKLSTSLGNLYRLLYTDNEISKLLIANSVWLDNDVDNKSIKYKDSYIDKVSKDYYSSLYSVDFADENTSKMISKWISDNTNGTLDYKGQVDPNQVMSILNTIYFYDQWASEFDEKDTKEDSFTLSNGEKVKSNFMNKTNESSSFFIGDGYKSSSLGLKNGSKMVFALPDEGVSAEELISTPEKIEEIFTKDESMLGQVVWKIPKFSYGDSLDLKEMIKSLGVKEAFSGSANFSDISNASLAISDVKQETYISIDEKGVEASAYTKIYYNGGGIPEDKIEMNLDRPFVYGIVSRQGTLLFVGVCNNPNSK